MKALVSASVFFDMVLEERTRDGRTFAFLRDAVVGTSTLAMAGALPAAFPNTAEAISAKGGSKLGTRFVGKLEGPTIIVDQSAFPKKFSEAPMLAELVKAGKLPPVEKRLPKSSDLMVIRPVHEIEKFGGRWRGGFTGPGDNENGNRIVSTADDFLFWDKDIYSNKELVPTPAPGIPDQRKIRGHHQERRPYRRL